MTPGRALPLFGALALVAGILGRSGPAAVAADTPSSLELLLLRLRRTRFV
jgi:hypothetical protein